jgi:Ser/Thr protein kinase RdoA (MazF antagonist)
MERKPDVDSKALAALLTRAFGSAASIACERTPQGVSAQVYRLQRAGEVFYLRVAEAEEQCLAVEAALLVELRKRGVGAPDVVFLEPMDAALRRSVLIMTEIPGTPVSDLARAGGDAGGALRAAGRDLAVLNQLPVQGFGWIRRDQAWPLRAELSTYSDFAVSDLPVDWPGELASLLTSAQLVAIEQVVDDERRQRRSEGLLAHGDFDATQVFQQDGRYTGIIDFGDIRGADPFFDLGTFHLQHGKRRPGLLPHILMGYRDLVELPADHARAIQRSALLLGIRQLSRWIHRPQGLGLDDPVIVGRARRIGELLSGEPREVLPDG